MKEVIYETSTCVHFEVLGKDALKLQDFYSKLFNWNIQNVSGMEYGMVETSSFGEKSGKGSIDGGIGASQPGTPGHLTFYAQVDDLDAYLKKVESLGGKTLVPATEIPNVVTFALFQDPEGNTVGLVKG